VLIALLFVSFTGAVWPGEPDSTAVVASEKTPASVDLRPTFDKWGLKPRRQGKRGTCSVFTLTGALEFAVANERQQGERLSVEFLNWAANQTGRHARDGGFFSEMWDGFAAHGICAETEMPYQAEFDPKRSPGEKVLAAAKEKSALGLRLHWIKKWNVKTGLSRDEFTGIKRTLTQGWPVCGGLRWPKQDQWKDDVLQMCPPEDVFDGHSVLLVGYRDDASQPGGGVLIFRNTNRGGRDGYMPYSYAQTYMNDAVWIDSKGKSQSAEHTSP
jgi:C1A family cysteine protease